MRKNYSLTPMRILNVAILLAMMWSVGVAAQPSQEPLLRADTLSIRFRLDSIRIDMEYADNQRVWDTFRENFNKFYAGKSPRAIRLDIYSGASPEGTAAHNRWLGENRGIAVRRLVRQQLGNQVGSIIVHNEAARWEGFYDAVAASNEPWRDEVLEIIEMPASENENMLDHRELKLRSLHGGEVWPVLLEKYLAPLRSGATAILSWDAKRDTVVVHETIVQNCPDTVPVARKAVALPPKPVTRRPAWILRTNIPLLATLTPNLQAEWSLDHRDRWSVNIEGVWSWWTFSHNAYANQLIYGSAEIRYWLGNRARHHSLDGWHVGLGVGGGYGDLEWKSKGYQFEVFMGYINFGWQHRFGRRKQWAFDAGIGVGFMHAPYRRYLGSTLYPEHHTEHYDDHLMWQETKHLNWVGPTHVNISIGYVFQPRKGAYRRRIAMERAAEENRYIEWRDSVRERERAERDSIEMRWYALPKAERKAAKKAYKEKLKMWKKNNKK